MLDFNKILADASAKKQQLTIEQAKLDAKLDELCKKYDIPIDDNLSDTLQKLQVDLNNKLTSLEAEILKLLDEVKLHN